MPANNDLFFRPLKSDRIEDVTFGFRAKAFGCVVYRIRTLALKKPENVRPIPVPYWESRTRVAVRGLQKATGGIDRHRQHNAYPTVGLLRKADG